MQSIRTVQTSLWSLALCFLCAAVFFLSLAPCHGADTIIVMAEGLADPDSETLKDDKAGLDKALLEDAKKQAIEKIVALYMDNPLLAKNYSAIDNDILARSRDIIQGSVQKSDPWLAGDGFMHILITAELDVTRVEKALRTMSEKQQVGLIRQAGIPRISVTVTVRDADRGSATKPERSPVAENILKEHISAFGYRVWSAQPQGKDAAAATMSNGQAADFSILGEVKFKPVHFTLETSGIEINKLTITSWTVKCIDNTTGEEIYFNNTIPVRRSWSTEDAAAKAIGKIIGEEFSQSFFERQLLQKTKMYQLVLQGLPTYDTAILFKNELIGLRPILNVKLLSFDNKAGANYEVEFAMNSQEFSDILNNSVLKPINKKFGKQAFTLSSIKNLMIKVDYTGSDSAEDISTKFQETPPSSLATASPVRLNQIAATRGTLDKVGEINPEGVKKVIEHRRSGGKRSLID